MNEAPNTHQKEGQPKNSQRQDAQLEIFPISSLIRFTLLSLYLALVLPLPALAPASLRLQLSLALLVGLLGLVSALSEQVRTSEAELSVGYPIWCSWLLRRSWRIRWNELKTLVPIRTSQGGTVFYLQTKQLNNQLLPQRIERFEQCLQQIQDRGGIDTTKVGRLTPAWTYQLLLGLSVLMLVGEGLTALSIWKGWIALPAGYGI